MQTVSCWSLEWNECCSIRGELQICALQVATRQQKQQRLSQYVQIARQENTAKQWGKLQLHHAKIAMKRNIKEKKENRSAIVVMQENINTNEEAVNAMHARLDNIKSNPQEMHCNNVTEGHFQNEEGQSVELACPAGWHGLGHPQVRSSCRECPAGYFQRQNQTLRM